METFCQREKRGHLLKSLIIIAEDGRGEKALFVFSPKSAYRQAGDKGGPACPAAFPLNSSKMNWGPGLCLGVNVLY